GVLEGMPGRLRSLLVIGQVPVALLVFASEAHAFPSKLEAWQQRYGAISPSADNASCQLCHGNANGGSPWNAYGWHLLMASSNPDCDLDGNGTVSDPEALYCVELDDSDGDGSGTDNVTEIGLGTQPGWALGGNNQLFSRSGVTSGVTAPTTLGQLDP